MIEYKFANGSWVGHFAGCTIMLLKPGASWTAIIKKGGAVIATLGLYDRVLLEKLILEVINNETA